MLDHVQLDLGTNIDCLEEGDEDLEGDLCFCGKDEWVRDHRYSIEGEQFVSSLTVSILEGPDLDGPGRGECCKQSKDDQVLHAVTGANRHKLRYTAAPCFILNR